MRPSDFPNDFKIVTAVITLIGYGIYAILKKTGNATLLLGFLRITQSKNSYALGERVGCFLEFADLALNKIKNPN